MERQVSSIIHHMSNSHREMAKVLEVNRDITIHMASMVMEIPDVDISFSGLDNITTNAMLITENITSYINAIADLEEAIAENLTYVIKEMSGTEESEE